MLHEQQVGCVLVNDDRGRLVALLTDRDLACAPARHQADWDTPVSTVMTREPLTVETSSKLERVIHLMEESGIRRIPVVERLESGDPVCVGIVTLDDLTASHRIGFEQIARIVRSQILRRFPSAASIARELPTGRAAHRASLNQFYATIEEKTGLPSELLIPVTRTILAALVARIHYTGAAQFIAQLPTGLQEPLLGVPPGPRPEITLNEIAGELSRSHGLSPEMAQDVIRGFFAALTELIDPAALERFSAQLPGELVALFPRRESGAA